MRTNKLWAAVGVLLFFFALSCTDTTKDKSITNNDLNKSVNPEDTTSGPSADSLTAPLAIKYLYSDSVKKDSLIRVSARLKKKTDSEVFRVTVYFSLPGKNRHKISQQIIRKQDRFMVEYTPSQNGELHILVEEEQYILGVRTWKNLKLVEQHAPVVQKSVQPGKDGNDYDDEDEEWCTSKKMLKAKDLNTEGGGGKGAVVKVEES